MKANTGVISAVRAMLAIVAVTFCAELLIMSVLMYLGYIRHSIGLMLVDAGVLSVLIAPPIYWLVAAPIKREYDIRQFAERRANELGEQAITDFLTGTRNRRGITISVLEAMAHAERYGHPLSVAMVDVDYFKEVNDTHGHKAGDRVLQGVAAILTEALRLPDKIGRYGGEEFLLVMSETGLEETSTLTERIRQQVSESEFDIGNQKVKLTISIGAVLFEKGEDLEQLVSRADRALYRAKELGRNSVVAG
ncbi:MAG: GGDEF domain-containing protein [Gammaproteobacteria bacterium]|nr:GGDEF domain-containing protein [Gammaproteobacteria bacterium]